MIAATTAETMVSMPPNPSTLRNHMTTARFLSRFKIAELLDLASAKKTYEVFPQDEWGNSIPESAVLALLNERRAGGQPELSSIPQLVSDRALAKSGRIMRDGKPLSLTRLRGMCKRVKFPVPHYRLSERRFAFTPDALDWWLGQIMSGTYVNQRRYIPA